MERNIDILTRVKLLMEYDMSMTYGENLTLVCEQSEFEMDRRFGIERRNMQALGVKNRKEYLDVVTKIDAPSISEALSKAREFFFTPGGMTAQLVLSILGSEIGLPVVFAVLDIAILINDFSIMISKWKPKDVGNEENWFIHHWETNIGFQYVIEDLVILLTGGILRLVGMGAKAAYKAVIAKFGKNIAGVVTDAEKIIISKEPMIKRLPKKISEWAQSKVNNLKKGINLLKTPKAAAKSVGKKILPAAAMGTANYLFLSWLDKKNKAGDSKALGSIIQIDPNEVQSYLVYENPTLFDIDYSGDRNKGDFWDYKKSIDGNFYAKNTKGKNTWIKAKGNPLVAIKNKFENEILPNFRFKSFEQSGNENDPVFIINGKKYKYESPKSDSFKLKKI